MNRMRRLSIALLLIASHGSAAAAQRPTNTNLRVNGCAHEGLIATGLFTTRFSATQSTYEKTDTLPTGFRLMCEQQLLVFEHQAWAGTSSANPDHWYEYWGVVSSLRDTLAYNRLQFIFSKLGGGNTVGILTLNDYEATSPSVLFAEERGYMTTKFFGRLTYVAPEYLRDIPVPKP